MNTVVIVSFMGNHYFLTFFLALIFASMVKHIFNVCINRPLRHMNIRKHGWPPEHCDADGDFINKDED